MPLRSFDSMAGEIFTWVCPFGPASTAIFRTRRAAPVAALAVIGFAAGSEPPNSWMETAMTAATAATPRTVKRIRRGPRGVRGAGIGADSATRTGLAARLVTGSEPDDVSEPDDGSPTGAVGRGGGVAAALLGGRCGCVDACEPG